MSCRGVYRSKERKHNSAHGKYDEKKSMECVKIEASVVILHLPLPEPKTSVPLRDEKLIPGTESRIE